MTLSGLTPGSAPPELQQQAQTLKPPKPPDTTPVNKDVTQGMPNADKLTPTEHAIYNALPGIAQSTVGQALAKFNETGVGKALQYLDIPAEGIERTVGTVIQLANQGPNEKIDLATAWYAGSLTYDLSNLPQFVYGDNPRKGQKTSYGAPEPDQIVTGFRVPNDLPGAAQGLAAVRTKLAQNVASGMSYKDALVSARDEYYNGLGALAIRAQMQDTIEHFALDPLNYILPALKPVEALQARRITAMTEKIAYSAEELTKMASAAKAAGKVEDAAQLVEAAAKVTKGELKTVNSLDKFAIFMTGGDIFNPSKLSQSVAKVPILNAFQLTPASKAQELMTLVSDNIGAKIIARLYNEPDAEEKIVQAIQRAASTATTDYGHAMLTVEGRTVQGFLGGSEALSSAQLADYVAVKGERQTLQILADALGDTPANILKNGDEKAALLFRTLSEKVPQLVQDGSVTEDTFRTLAGVFDHGNLPFNKDTFIVHLMAGIEDHAMRQAVVQFGVEPTKFLTRWSNAIKSAESLAFMRLNPAYGIRNLVNNDVTMIARGVFGLMAPEEIDAFWKTAGFIPKRLAEGFSSGGEVERQASAVLQDALKGGNYGAPEKIQDFFRKVNLGKVDITAWSRGVESAASKQSFTSGFMQFMREHWKPTKLADHLDSASMDALNKIDPELAGKIDSAIRSSGAVDRKLTDVLAANLNLSSQAVVDAATQKLGMKVEDVLGTEVLNYVHDGLAEAIKNGKTEQFIFAARQKINAHVEDLFQKNMADLVGNAKNQVAVGGYSAIYDTTGQVMDTFWGGQIEHAMKTPEAAQLAREAATAKDFKQANGLWVKIKADDEQFFGRLFKRTDAYLQGLEEGAKEAGIKFPKEVRQAFKNFQDNWRGFFEWKNAEQEAFFKAKLEGKEYRVTWDALQKEVSTRYQNAGTLEDSLMQSVDDAIAQQIPENLRPSFLAYRDQMATLRRDFKKSVREFYTNIQNVPAEERQALFNQFAYDRAQRLTQMKNTDQAGRAMLQGDPNAAQMFAPKVTFGGGEGTSTAAPKPVTMLEKPVGRGPGNKTFANFQQYAEKDGLTSEKMLEDWMSNGPETQKWNLDPNVSAESDAQVNAANIYDLANQYGIPSASEQGVRNDRRILNTVNKYAPQAMDAEYNRLNQKLFDPNTPKAELESIRKQMAAIDNSVRKPTEQNLLVKATQVPRSELPQEISDKIALEAKGMMSELSGGQAGFRSETANIPSTNATWYRELYAEKGLGKPEINKALEKIIADQGKDKGVNVERIKDLIIDRLTFGDKATGTPPDLYALKQLGAGKDTLEQALKDFNQMTGKSYTLEDALVANGAPIEEVAQYLSKTPGKYTKVSEIPYDVAKQAFEARAAEKGTVKAVAEKSFIADYKQIVPDLKPVDLGIDENAYGRQYAALDAIVEAAQDQKNLAPALLKDLPKELQDKVLGFLDRTRNEFGDARLAATRFGEFRRDSALLNYNRRTNFDTFLGNIMPYSFWTTHSMAEWAINSIDRPAMLTTYLRMKKFLETAGAPQSGFPSRFKDNIRIKLPFTPDWMGSQFVDPLSLALPFDAFTQPFDQWQQNQQTVAGRTQRLLQDQLDNGKITQMDFNEAMQNQSGPTWDYAASQVAQNDESLRFDAWDFASLMSTPHAPLVWAYNAARGTPENIGPFTPMSGMVKNVATMLGVQDWNNSSYNLEAKVRKGLGLPAFDKWDTYRTDRMLSNMATEGKYSVDQIKKAMILNDQITKGMPIEQAMQDENFNLYMEATQRANQEKMGGTLGGILGFFAVRAKAYPEGEQIQRALQSQFSEAYDRYNKANDALQTFMDSHPGMSQKDALDAFTKQNPSAAKDAAVLTDFFNAHPEYETRLGLFDKPEDRLKKMLVDQTWAQWNSLPKLTQNELKDQLGSQFNEAFLTKETRSYDSITPELMQTWVKLMGGNPVGTMSADQNLLIDLFGGNLKLTDPELAWRAQTFYDFRKQNFPNYYEEQNAYYDPTSSSYKKAPEDLKAYWDWRRTFLINNPDIVPYLTDNQKDIQKALNSTRNPKYAVPTAQELNIQVSPSMQRLVQGYQQGQDLTPAAEQYLELIGQRYGLSGDQVLHILSGK